jgi:phosphogluconate dehydratase
MRTAVGRADEGAHVFATLARTAELGEHTLTPTMTTTEQPL